ncbi:MAG: Gfo/Idh/MocA family oxidoreductase [Planctomycetaceae bacterium]|nr:Gfo/Idh/MocA family oxidoreductase [Planctomycetaceae bacterium]
MSPLRFAVIGAGRLGGFHAQKLAARKDVALTAIVDPVPSARQRVAEACGATALPDFDAVLNQLDAVIVATPTRLHYDVVRRCIEAGVHTFVEKPICPTVAESSHLVDLARMHNVVLQVGHVERFNPAFEAVASQVSAPKYIEAVRTSGFTFRSTDVGAVLDLMIHDIDLVLSLVGGPLRKVDALGVSVVGGHEDAVNARLEFECGCVATLSASRVSPESVRRMQIWSAQTMAQVDFAARTALLVHPSETLRRREFHLDQLRPEEIEPCRQRFAEEHLPQEQLSFEPVDALALEQEDFISSIRTSKTPRVDGAAGRNAVAVAEQILDRVQSHCWDASWDGPVGPKVEPRRHVIPAPHFDRSARVKAG